MVLRLLVSVVGILFSCKFGMQFWGKARTMGAAHSFYSTERRGRASPHIAAAEPLLELPATLLELPATLLELKKERTR